MDAAEFTLLQEGLMWAGPIALWMAALVLASGVFAGGYSLFGWPYSAR